MAGIWVTWQSVSALMVLLSFLLVAFAYMIGIGFMLPRVKGWARNEFYQAIANAIIVGGMVVLIASINGLMNGITGSSVCPNTSCCKCDAATYPALCDYSTPGGYAAAFDYAKCFMDSERFWLLANYGTLLGINILVGVMVSWHQYVSPYQQGFSFSLMPGFATVSDFIGLVMMGTAGGAILLTINSLILDFLRYKLMALFPIGIGLRSFPFTRSAGGAIVAVVVGFYVLYPMMFYLDSLMFANDTKNFTEFMGGATSLPGGDVPFVGGIIAGIISTLYRPIYDVVVVGLFLPLFNLTITLSFTREFAKVMGGDVDISSLTKLL